MTRRSADFVRALEGAGLLAAAPGDDLPVTGVTEDSRRVQAGALFCAVRGTSDDGHRHVPDAVERGAVVAVVEEAVEVAVPQIVVTDGRAAAAVCAATWFDRPAAGLDLIGITGTNGKSTTAALVQHLLSDGDDVGLIGTLGAFDGRGEALYREGLTTPGAMALHGAFARLRETGARAVAMEVSSHALDQQRVFGIEFRAAVFTNLTHDHLDYHETFEAYLAAKARLAELVGPGGVILLNADEPRWAAVPVPAGVKRATFGVHAAADIRARDVRLSVDGAEFQLQIDGNRHAARSPLLGAFNVSNAVAALAASIAGGGVAVEDAVRRLASAPQVAGRMEPLVSEPYLVLRDYAHTPDALRRAIGAARPLARRRLVVLFGCGGDRDRAKRPAMGEIAARDADLAIVTSDNPRTEDPERIIDDIVEGMGGEAFIRLVDRREAIGRALARLEPGDVLLLAGKGHETYQVLGNERVPFDERAIVREIEAAKGAG